MRGEYDAETKNGEVGGPGGVSTLDGLLFPPPSTLPYYMMLHVTQKHSPSCVMSNMTQRSKHSPSPLLLNVDREANNTVFCNV